jgi:hypothetical protein
MQKSLTQEEINQAIIEEYEFKSHLRSEQHDINYKVLAEALKPLVNENLEYLRYAIAKGWFSMTEEEMNETALHNALVHLVGREMKWSIDGAYHFAFEILQDVNAHTEAAQVAKVLGLNLKPYEVE